MRLGQTSIVYFVSRVFGSLLGFLATVYIARILGETVLGYYSLTLNLALWLAIGGKIGLTGAIIKRVSEGDDREEFVTAGFLIAGTMLIVVSMLALVFQSTIHSYVGASITVFLILIVFVDLFKGIINAALKGYHLVHIYAPLSTAKVGVRSVAQIAFVFFGFGLGGILVGYAFGGILVGLVGIWVLKFRPSLPRKHHFVSLFDYAKFSWLGNVRGRAFSSIDILILGVFVQAGFVGIYTVAWSVGKFLDIFGEAIGTTLFPEMSKIATEDGTQAVGNLTQDALSFAGLILVPGIVGGAIIGDRLLLIYGENFPQGAHILVILVAALLIYTYTKQILNTLNAIDRPDLAFRANGAFIVANVVLNVLLVYQYGWIGAAVATALSAAVGLTIAFYYARQLVDFAVPYGEITRQWIAALLMGAVVYLAREAGEGTAVAAINEAFVVLLVALGAGVYFLTLLAISTTFRTTVSRNLPIDVPRL